MKTKSNCKYGMISTSFLLSTVGCVLVMSLGMVVSTAFAQVSTAHDGAVEPVRNGSVMKSASQNVYSAGSHVRPKVVIDGDFVAAGGRVIIDQPVKKDLILAGCSIDIRAAVGDDVRVAGCDISAENSIAGELVAAGGSITLTNTARVASTASLFGGTVIIDGRVDGPLTVGAQKLVVNGEVNNDARLRAEEIEIGPTGKITGTVSYASPNEIKLMDGATIGGTVTREDEPRTMRGRNMNREMRDWHAQRGSGGQTWFGSVFTYLALLACASVFFLVFPVFSAKASDTVRTSPWTALALGFSALVGVPVLAVLLFVTILGIPMGIILLALYPVLLLMGYVVSVLFVAQRAEIAMRKNTPPSFVTTIGFFALALLLMMLLGRIPFVGGLAVFIIVIIGVGASMIEMYSRRQVDGTPPPAVTPHPPSAPSSPSPHDTGSGQMMPAGT